MRHFKVNFKPKFFYDSKSFTASRHQYKTGDILVKKKHSITDKIIYTSKLKRSTLTAQAYGSGNKITSTLLLNEVPITAFMSTRHPLPNFVWMSMAALQWLFNSKKQPETRVQTQARVCKFLGLIEEKNQDCTVVGHGAHFFMMVIQLKKRGYHGPWKGFFRNGEKVSYSKPQPKQKTPINS